MNSVNQEPSPVGNPGHQPWSDRERSAITEEMDQILADPAFKSSKRCQALLRRLIEHALVGDHDGMKERTLGVEVFGREASYDTSSDPIVRITANEIRKRLGQWYQEPNRHHAVRIRLVAGSYLPKFDFESVPAATEASEEKPAANQVEPQEAGASTDEASPKRTPFWQKPILLGAVALGLLIAVILLVRPNFFNTGEFSVWEPLTQQQTPLILCISDEDWQADARAQGLEYMDLVAKVIDSREVPQKGNSPIMGTYYPAVDAFIANKITNRIALHGKQTTLRRSSELSFDDLRHQPVVIIAGLNPWSLILLSKLRYSVRVDPVTHTRWIQDSGNPSSRKWTVADTLERADVDYAIVSRFRDPETGQWIISLGGLYSYGTVSACSLLTDSEYAYMLPRAFHTSQNAQIVLKTNVINGNAGPPQVVAVYTW
jgi:hypothetical protein